jgi:hypothetical protein
MGVEYDLVSNSTREGYELGKGCWGCDEFEKALRSDDPVGEATAHMIEENGFESAYAAEVAREIAAFVAAHPDWKIINDAQSEYCVVTDEERDELLAEKWWPDDELGSDDFPIYKKLGSRYR